MHNFHKDWRVLLLGAAVLGLVLLPAASAMAEGPSSVLNGSAAGAGFGPTTPQQGQSLHRGQPYPRANYMWPYATGPVYGQVPRSEWNSPGVIHTAVGSFELQRGVASFPAELRTDIKFGRLGAQYFILQLTPSAIAGGALDGVRQVVESNGGAIVQSMAVASFIARLTQPAYEAVSGMPGVRAVEPYHPAFKLAPTIGRVPLYDPVKAVSDVYDLDVQIFPGEDAGAVAQAIANLGGNVRANWGDVIRVELDRNQLAALASLEPVRMIFEHLPMIPKGEETTTTMQTGRYNFGAIPYHDEGIDGSGGTIADPQKLMVLDSGIQVDAGDLSNTHTTAGTPGPSHRKVLEYKTTNPFGGSGDLLGCDDSLQGGFSHGHVVSATALGNATDVDPSYGEGWTKTDSAGNIWKLDGVAPKALVVAYDAQVTPSSGACDDPFASGGLSVGNIYTRGGSGDAEGSLADGYNNYGVRITNFSWGSENNPIYGTNAQKIDQFLFDYKDAMVFLSAGNEGDDTDDDGIPDPNSVSDPATCKNAVVVGASYNANDDNPGSSSNPETRAFFSSVGPATTASNRIAPLLMAPGTDSFNGMGIDSEFTCRTNDNDSDGPVECDLLDNMSGTSFSSPAAAGAALLVRDYFAQGFYPEKKSIPGNATNISGAMVKAILVASADYMSGSNLSRAFRFNTEQGYGRIQLDNAVPLTTWPTPNFLVVADGGISGGPNNTSLSGTAQNNVTETYDFKVNDNTQELRIACAWIEDNGETMSNDIDLELCPSDGAGSCISGQPVYLGNFFTEDVNDNNVLDTGEDCDADGEITSDQWSLDTTGCSGDKADHTNPTEGVFLSPDPEGNGIEDDPDTPGIDESADNQIRPGDWTLKVKGTSISAGGGQPYACAIAGPVALQSSISFDQGSYVCNGLATITVNEVDETSDPATGLNATEVASRVTVQVLDPSDTVVDQEDGSGLGFTQPDSSVLRFVAEDIVLTDGTARDPSSTYQNGVLDIRSGDRLKAIYADETSGSPDPDKERTNRASTNCAPAVSFGGIEWGMYGRNAYALVNGGCERDARGMFTFGFPDQYMDAGETLGYRIAFRSSESSLDLEGAEVTLRCVQTDTDSPADCKPGDFDACADPNRENNPDCSGLLTILDSPKVIGKLPAGAVATANFTVKMADTITGTPEIEMLMGVKSPTSGKPITGLVVSRHKLDVDQFSVFYSTDYPTGGVEYRDYDNDESILNAGDLNCTKDVPCTEGDRGTPSTDLDFEDDYRFEAIQWSDLSVNGSNPTSTMPWNFDSGKDEFRVGLHLSTSTEVTAVIANWGEDKNFNNVLDPDLNEDRDPVNNQLDNNWSTEGGCGWQTPYGSWHTGTIKDTGQSICLGSGNQAAQCQRYEVVPGYYATSTWTELLKTPEFYKVNGSDFQVEFMNWAWNSEISLADNHSLFLWELDTDTKSTVGSNLDTFPVLNLIGGAHGARTGGNAPITDGFPTYATNNGCSDDHSVLCARDEDCDALGLGTCVYVSNSRNGTQGNNRSGKNCCYFETSDAILPLHLAQPADDDIDNDRRCENDSDYACTDNAHCGVCTGDNSTFCNDNADCSDAGLGSCDTAASGTSCLSGDASIDEYVSANGPIRNFDITQVNGPDMRYTTLEDVYGTPAGDSFQAAFGFYTEEGTPLDQPTADYGVGVDDVVVEWREFKLDKDATTCDPSSGGGECANLELQSSLFYEGSAILTVRVLDSTPYGPDGKNNCNLDRVCENDTNISCETSKDCTSVGGGCVADLSDPEDDNDCNDNGTPDVIAKASVDTTTDVEAVIMDEVSPGEYQGNLPVSSAYDVPGTLFIARSGTNFPTVDIRYEDLDDGTGNRCPNAVDPDEEGFVDAATTISFDTGTVVVVSNKISNDAGKGDGDGFADTNETVNMTIKIANKTGRDLDNVVARLATSDPKIDCIINPFIDFGTVAEDATVDSADLGEAFIFKVAPFANRTGGTCSGGTCDNDPLRSCTSSSECDFGVNDDYSTTFVVTMSSNLFDGTARTQSVTVDLDLNATGGGGAGTYVEDFEVSSGFDDFTSQSLDTGKNTNALSDGYRCQYSDPDDPGSNSYGDQECFLGFTDTGNNGFDWHVHTTTTSGDGGRAYTGTRSLHWGVHKGGDPDYDTTRFAQLDAVISKDPINLAWDNAAPELSFKQQISLMDYRQSNSPLGEGPDRGVVHIRLADSGGNGIGNWLKVFPYQNVYDVQGTDFFTNCMFDPIDDGNNEDDRFPAPQDRLGPSSTCYPEFVFGWQGDTNWNNTFNANALGRAEGPGLQGSIDRGTWVETKFDLSRYLGRRLRLRFLATSIKVEESVDYQDAGWDPGIPYDDGWYIDDVEVTDTLSIAATLSTDENNNSGLPPCGVACNTLTAVLTSDPAGALGAPGQVVTLDASDSSSDRCLNGTLQYQFWIDGDANGTVGDPADTMLRDWTDNPFYVDAPLNTTTYAVKVQCSADPTCGAGTNVATKLVEVTCPSNGTLVGSAFPDTVVFNDKSTLAWPTSHQVDVDRGDLITLRSSGTFTGSVDACLADNVTTNSITDATTPTTGGGLYYLVRTAGPACNEAGSWGTGSDSVDRDSQLNADGNSCP